MTWFRKDKLLHRVRSDRALSPSSSAGGQGGTAILLPREKECLLPARFFIHHTGDQARAEMWGSVPHSGEQSVPVIGVTEPHKEVLGIWRIADVLDLRVTYRRLQIQNQKLFRSMLGSRALKQGMRVH